MSHPPSPATGRAPHREEPGESSGLLSPERIALLFLGAITLAEGVTIFVSPLVGLLLHVATLLALVFTAAQQWDRPLHALALSLTFAPMIRIFSLTLPLSTLPRFTWYLIVSLPLFVAAGLLVRLGTIPWQEMGLRLGNVPLQLAIGLTGFGLGAVEYAILRPDPLVVAAPLPTLLLAGTILFVSTGFLEELLFRGIMQSATLRLLAVPQALLYVALLFAVLHIGYYSLLDVLFVFGAGLLFGWVSYRTRSLLGVTIAHGLTNITLFLILPTLLGQ